jgi:hypothetical protein
MNTDTHIFSVQYPTGDIAEAFGLHLEFGGRVVTSGYVPMEARRGFNAMESRGFRYRIRLVAELLPKRSVLAVMDSAAFTKPKFDFKKLRDSLNSCLSCQPTKALLDK